MITSKTLQELGLSKHESQIYIALLALKKASVTTIAEKAKVNRTTTYDILDKLNTTGLVSKYLSNKKTTYAIDSPQRLKAWMKDKEKKLNEQKSKLNDAFSEIDYLFKATAQAPKIQYFEGRKKAENFFNDSLTSNPSIIYGYSATHIIAKTLTEKYSKYYARERYKRNILGKYIVQEIDKESTLQYTKRYYGKYLNKKPHLIKTKILPHKKTDTFLNETIVYNNKVAISHMGNNFFGVIVESEDVANTQRIVFESLWKTLKEEIKIN